MKRKLLSIIGLILLSFHVSSQIEYTTFEIPTQSKEAIDQKKKVGSILNNCESCNAALDPALREKTTSYKQSNLRDWLYQYFKSNEEHRRAMKNNASNNASLNAVVKSIPIKFGYNSNESKEYNYWNKKHIEWQNTRLISIDDIAYLFKSDSKDQLQAWLECKKVSCVSSAANYADSRIFLDVEIIRDGLYNITLTNISLANIKITDIQVDELLDKVSGKKFRIKSKVSNKGGNVSATFKSKTTLDTDFSMTVSYDIIGTEDQGTTTVTYRVKPELPDAPIGTIITTTLTYAQFLKINQIENLSASEQIWLPCDGRVVSNGNYITKTPDLRGLFIRGVNRMDPNELLHTSTVVKNQSNPDNSDVGKVQMDAFQGHKHFSQSTLVRRGSDDLPNYPDQRPNQRNANNSAGVHDAGYGKPRLSTETRPKNMSVIYLIRVR